MLNRTTDILLSRSSTGIGKYGELLTGFLFYTRRQATSSFFLQISKAHMPSGGIFDKFDKRSVERYILDQVLIQYKRHLYYKFQHGFCVS